MKESVICQPWNPIETWQFIKAVAKTVWEWIKIEIRSIH